MPILTIPKKLIQKDDDLVIVPRKQYEALLRSQQSKATKEVSLTAAQSRIIAEARKNIASGKFLTIHELKRRLGSPNRRKGA